MKKLYNVYKLNPSLDGIGSNGYLYSEYEFVLSIEHVSFSNIDDAEKYVHDKLIDYGKNDKTRFVILPTYQL